MSDAAQFPVNFPCYTLHTSPADVRNTLPRFSGITYLNHPRARNRVSRRRRKEVKKKKREAMSSKKIQNQWEQKKSPVYRCPTKVPVTSFLESTFPPESISDMQIRFPSIFLPPSKGQLLFLFFSTSLLFLFLPFSIYPPLNIHLSTKPQLTSPTQLCRSRQLVLPR